MSSVTANLPVLVVIAPLFVAFILTTFARRIRLVEGLVIFIGILGFVGAGFLAANVFIKKNSNDISSGRMACSMGHRTKSG